MAIRALYIAVNIIVKPLDVGRLITVIFKEMVTVLR